MGEPYEKCRELGSASRLSGHQQVLFIFVDDEGADSWTRERRESVERDVGSALRWLEQEAARHGVQLYLCHAFAPVGALAEKASMRINESDTAAGPHHSTWQNGIAQSITKLGGWVGDLWKDLFARHGLLESNDEGRLTLFGVRREYSSISFPYSEGQHTEFSKERGIIYHSDRQIRLDALIAHELLHLYGAVDLVSSKFPADAVHVKDVTLLNTRANEIMATPSDRPINESCVGPFTAYLVGWRPGPPEWLLSKEARPES